MLETCAPKSINMVTLYPSTNMVASLDHPTRWAVGSWFKKGMPGVAYHGPVHQPTFMVPGLGLGSRWECEGLLLAEAAVVVGVSHIPSGWFKANAGVGHSLAMWPHPWHIRHWREFGSC